MICRCVRRSTIYQYSSVNAGIDFIGVNTGNNTETDWDKKGIHSIDSILSLHYSIK